MTPKNSYCLRRFDGKYGKWDEIVQDILNGKFRIVQNKRTETDTENDEDDEEMPEDSGKNYKTSERDGRYVPIRFVTEKRYPNTYGWRNPPRHFCCRRPALVHTPKKL